MNTWKTRISFERHYSAIFVVILPHAPLSVSSRNDVTCIFVNIPAKNLSIRERSSYLAGFSAILYKRRLLNFDFITGYTVVISIIVISMKALVSLNKINEELIHAIINFLFLSYNFLKIPNVVHTDKSVLN